MGFNPTFKGLILFYCVLYGYIVYYAEITVTNWHSHFIEYEIRKVTPSKKQTLYYSTYLISYSYLLYGAESFLSS